MNNPFSILVLTVSLLLILPGLVLTYFGVRLLMPAPIIIGLVGVVLGTLMHTNPHGWHQIPNDPIYKVGLITFWGLRTNTGAEGWVLLADYFPFNIGIIEFEWKKNNADIPVTNIRCKSETGGLSGGAVDGKISINFYPDKRNLKTFADSGRENGVEDILEDRTKRLTQITASGDPGRTWQQMEASGDDVRQAIWKQLTGENMPMGAKPAIFTPSEINTVLSLGICLESIDAHFSPSGELLSAALGSEEEIQLLNAETLKAKRQTSIARVYFDALIASGQQVDFSVVLESVRSYDAVNKGHGTIIKGGNILDAALAQSIVANQQPTRRGKK